MIVFMIKICLYSGVEKSELDARSGEPVEDVGESKSILICNLCWLKIIPANSAGGIFLTDVHVLLYPLQTKISILIVDILDDHIGIVTQVMMVRRVDLSISLRRRKRRRGRWWPMLRERMLRTTRRR